MDKTEFFSKCSQVYAKMLFEAGWDLRIPLFNYLNAKYNSKKANLDPNHRKNDVFYKSIFDLKTISEHEQLPLDQFIVLFPAGGISGGACWETSNPQRYFEQPPKVFSIPQVETFLTEAGIRPLTFKEFEDYRKLYVFDMYIYREYYGNESHFFTLELDFDQLWEFYSEHKL